MSVEQRLLCMLGAAVGLLHCRTQPRQLLLSRSSLQLVLLQPLARLFQPSHYGRLLRAVAGSQLPGNALHRLAPTLHASGRHCAHLGCRVHGSPRAGCRRRRLLDLLLPLLHEALLGTAGSRSISMVLRRRVHGGRRRLLGSSGSRARLALAGRCLLRSLARPLQDSQLSLQLLRFLQQSSGLATTAEEADIKSSK
jgi:hypothetical protein